MISSKFGYKVSLYGVLYFLSGIVIQTVKFNGTTINQYIKYVIASVWGLLLIANIYRGWKRSNRRSIVIRHLRLMVAPFIVIAIYTLIIWLFRSDVSLGNYTRLASTVFYLLIAWLYASCGYYLFGSKVLDYLFWSGIWSYVLGSIFPLIIKYNFRQIIDFLKSTVTGQNTVATPLMEVHDLTFAMGMFFLYYMFFDSAKSRLHKTKIVLSILMIIFGLKRIEVLALGVSVLSYYIFLRRGKNIQWRSTLFLVAFTIISYAYIYLASTGLLEELANSYSLNFMGRIGFYNYARDYYSFSPLYFGTGYTFFSRYWQKLYLSGFRINGYGIAASIHSDILSMYIEVGFVMTIIWIYFYFKKKTNLLKKKYGLTVAEYYLLSTVFMFILYLTDNTSTYFITQMIYFVIPLVLSDGLNVTKDSVFEFVNQKRVSK